MIVPIMVAILVLCTYRLCRERRWWVALLSGFGVTYFLIAWIGACATKPWCGLW